MSSITENPEERAIRYIKSLETAIEKFTPINADVVVIAQAVKRVTDTMNRYLNDAHYYLQNGKPVTALASVAYAEGLMDALSFLELAKTKSTA
jgi:FAD synthetase